MVSLALLMLHMLAALMSCNALMRSEDARLWALPSACLIAWYLYYGAATFTIVPNAELYINMLEVASWYSLALFASMAALGGGLQSCQYWHS